jgi:2'-5' RNA ligase
VWVGIRNGAQELSQIFQRLEPQIVRLGLTPDRRGFSPHLTIARVKSGRNRQQMINILSSYQDHSFGSFIADSLKLKQSILLPRGPQYTVLFEVHA